MAQLVGPKILLEGDSGAGKTHSLLTLVDAGLEVFLVATDNGVETLSKGTPEQLKHIHWMHIPPVSPNFAALRDVGNIINKFNNKALQDMTDSNKSKYVQMLDIIDRLMNFKDQHGVSYGNVDSWGPERALVVDNLSGVNLMCRTLAVGGKPLMTQPDWGVSMDYELRFVQMCCALNCTFVLVAHIEKEVDELRGGMKGGAAALGRKNAPQLPKDFSDVILAKRGPDQKYYWDNIDPDFALKHRNLPPGNNLPPTFVPLIEAWRKSSSFLSTGDNANQAKPKP